MPLNQRSVETLGPGRHTDRDGLVLDVKPSGKRSWILRYQVHGRRHDLGLGRYPEVGLKRAREKALKARQLIAEGEDPIVAKRRRVGVTFREAAEALIESKRAGWKNAKHAAQWPSTLTTYAYPKLGSLDVKLVDTAAVIDVLRPIWTTKPETASRLRQRIEAVLDYASVLGQRTGDNPARWRGHLEALLPSRASVRQVEHHAALDWRHAPAFMAELAVRSEVAAQAFRFLVLTAARSGEVREMTWLELDLDSGVWTIPASRMKAGKEHRVPLSPEARSIVAAMRELVETADPSALVFPGTRGKPMSDATMSAVLRRMKRTDLTVHGFRSTFRDWAGETTAHPREVIEAALAHRLKDKAEAAYARGDLFTKRRALMEDWARYVHGLADIAVDPVR